MTASVSRQKLRNLTLSLRDIPPFRSGDVFASVSPTVHQGHWLPGNGSTVIRAAACRFR